MKKIIPSIAISMIVSGIYLLIFDDYVKHLGHIDGTPIEISDKIFSTIGFFLMSFCVCQLIFQILFGENDNGGSVS